MNNFDLINYFNVWFILLVGPLGLVFIFLISFKQFREYSVLFIVISLVLSLISLNVLGNYYYNYLQNFSKPICSFLNKEKDQCEVFIDKKLDSERDTLYVILSKNQLCNNSILLKDNKVIQDKVKKEDKCKKILTINLYKTQNKKVFYFEEIKSVFEKNKDSLKNISEEFFKDAI